MIHTYKEICQLTEKLRKEMTEDPLYKEQKQIKPRIEHKIYGTADTSVKGESLREAMNKKDNNGS